MQGWPPAHPDPKDGVVWQKQCAARIGHGGATTKPLAGKCRKQPSAVAGQPCSFASKVCQVAMQCSAAEIEAKRHRLKGGGRRETEVGESALRPLPPHILARPYSSPKSSCKITKLPWSTVVAARYRGTLQLSPRASDRTCPHDPERWRRTRTHVYICLGPTANSAVG